MGRNEVLENVQAFTEICRNRRLDNRPVRFGHQAAHPGQLANLRRRTARAGVSHHVDGVEGLLLDLLPLPVDDFLVAELLHHDLGHLIAGTAPDIDHLVVALAVGHQAIGVLALDLLNFLFGRSDDFTLLRRDEHVVRTDRDARTSRQTVAVLHQLVGEYDRFLQPAATERGVYQFRDFFLLQRSVEDTERQPFGQNFGKQRPTGRRRVARHLLLPNAILILVKFLDANRDLGVNVEFASVHRTGDFRQIGEGHPFALRVDPLTRRIVQAENDIL